MLCKKVLKIIIIASLGGAGLYAKKNRSNQDGLSKYEDRGSRRHHEEIVPVEPIILPTSSALENQESDTNFDNSLFSSSVSQPSNNVPSDDTRTPENKEKIPPTEAITTPSQTTTNQTAPSVTISPVVTVAPQQMVKSDSSTDSIGSVPLVKDDNPSQVSLPVVENPQPIIKNTPIVEKIRPSVNDNHGLENPVNSTSQSPAVVPLRQTLEQVETLDDILNTANNSTVRVNENVKNKLSPYFSDDMFDDTRTIGDLEKELVKKHYDDTLADLSRVGSAGQQLQEDDTAILLQQKGSSSLSLAQEIHLYNRTPGVPFKLLSTNLHLFPSSIHAQISSLREPVERARAMGKIVMHAQDKFDVIVVQEAWDKTCRDIFYNEISSVYKYRVEDNYQSYLSVLRLNVILGSGLAIYSKYPFETFTTPEEQKQNYHLQTFSDNRTDQVFTYKGFLIVKIMKQGIPIYIVNTHLAPDSRDWEKFIAPEKQPLEVVVREMEEIKAALRFIMMNDYYAQELQAIVEACETDKVSAKSYFKQYIINIGKKIAGKTINKSATNSPRMQCVTDKIKEYSEKKPNFWSQVYVFVAGDFNNSTSKDEYSALTETFGAQAQTILSADKDKLTVVPATSLSYRTDHILSIGKHPVETKSGMAIGGSYVSDIFNHNNTRHLALELVVKLEE